MDGAEVVLPASIVLPDTIEFPHFRSVARRDIYRLTAEGETQARYAFDHVEVGA